MQKIISILLFVIFICNLFYLCSSEDFKYCTDPKCSGPISEAVTKLSYNAPDLHVLSFAKGMKVKVFSKLKGSEKNYWGIEFNGKRGYVPSSFIKEVRIIHKIPLVKVPYNIPDDLFPAIPVKGNSENAIKTDIPAGITDEIPTPQNVLSPHEVVEGTTLYLDPEDNIISPTENSVESTFTDKPDFISNNEYEDEEEDWDLEYNDVRDMKNENKETSAESLSETIAKENFESKSETDSKNIESDLRSIETQNLTHSDEVNTATSKQSDIENNADIKENSTFNDANIENNLESESNNLKKETESITEINNNVSVSPEPSADASELLTSEHDKVSEVKSSPELSSESIVDKSKQKPLEELVNNMANSSDSNVETKEDNSEIKNPLLNINSEVKSDEVKNTETTTDFKVINSDDNSEVKSDENASTFTDDSVLNSEDNSKVKHEETIGVSNNDISLDSKVNFPNVIESVEYSTSMKVNPNSNTIDSLNDPRPFDSSETIETTTDNTTAYSYKPEEISENKNEQQSSVDRVILSPEIDDSILSHKQDSQHDANLIGSDSEKQSDNLVENLSSDRQHIASDGADVSNSEKQPDNLVENLSSDRQHIASDGVDVSNSPNKFDSHQFPNSINILDQLNNALPTNNIESNTKKYLENSQEDITKSEEHFHFENFVMDSDEKKNEVPNLDNANSDNNVVTENSNDNVLIQSEENGISDVMSDVNLEQADFLTTVYEFFGIYQSKEPEVELASGPDFSNVESRSIIGNNEEVYSKKEEFVCKNPNSENIYSLQQFEIPESTYGIIIYLTITAITVLIFTLGYYYIEKLRQDGTLVKRINELEKALLNSNKEKNILRNELELSQGAEAPISLLEKLRDELEESNRLRIELEEQNVNLERELETATEAGLELNKMLGEYLSSQQSGNLVEESLEYLQKQLNDQQLTIAEMTVSANEKAKEFETNLAELNIAREKITELTSELNSLVVNFTKLQEDSYTRETQLNEQIAMLKTQLEKEINQKNQEINEKNNELNQIRQLSKELQHDLNVKENEFVLLKENLQSKKGGENNVESIIDNTHIRAELKEVNAEKELLIKQLEAEIERKKAIENQLTQMVAEKDNLHSQLQNVEKEKIETQTRLEVLSAYFKEKETQLQKELAKYEELWSQNQGQANSTVERIKLLQEEIQNYKTQNEMLRNEIVDQEVSLKSQISVMEKKNHENWLLLRQTERRLEESKHECSQLRNRLTIVEKNLSSEDKSQFRVVSPPLNGDISTSPIHMIEPPVSSPLLFPHRDNMPTTPPINFMGLPPPPPPPGALPFMPPPPPGVPFMPPPPTLFPGDRRPPPLGRMSSPPPPPPNTFSPPRTFSPYDQDRDSPPIRDRMYNLYDNDNNYRHRSPPPFAPLPPPHTDQGKDWENRQSFRPIDQQRPTNRSKTNLNSNEFV